MATREAPEDFDYTAVLAKAPTELHEHLAGWIKEKTGLTFGTAKEEAAYLRGVQLGALLRMKHQSSPENTARREAAAAASAEAKETAVDAAPVKKTAPAKKAPAKKAVPAAEAPAPTPAAPGKKKKAAKAGTPSARAPF
jgi:hypothetical protein